jgi:hypothetical protein
MSKTRKNIPWRGWKREKPGFHQRTTMMNKCGKKCFLGKKKSFPICKKNTCTVSKKGVYAAFIRAQQYLNKTGKKKYRTISNKAKKMIKKMF